VRYSESRPVIFLKQHPGENSNYSFLPKGRLIVIPKIIPIEMFYFYALNNGIKSLYIYTFGSTAAINLYMMLKNICRVEIVVLTDHRIPFIYSSTLDKFRQLAQLFEIKYHTLKL